MDGLRQVIESLESTGGVQDQPHSLSTVKELNARIRGLIDVEMGYIASLHEPEQLVAREAAFQEVLQRLVEARQRYLSAVPELATGDGAAADEAVTQEYLRLAVLINPARYLGADGDKVVRPAIERDGHGLPIPTDDGISRLAVRLLLMPGAREYPLPGGYWPMGGNSMSNIRRLCCDAFRPDAQWATWESGTMFEAYALIDHNLVDIPADRPPPRFALRALTWLHGDLFKNFDFMLPAKVAELHNSAVRSLPRIAKQLADANDIVALGKLLFDTEAAVNAHIVNFAAVRNYDSSAILLELRQQFEACVSRVDTSNALALADGLTACYLSRSAVQGHGDLSMMLVADSDLTILSQLDFSRLTQDHLLALDELGAEQCRDQSARPSHQHALPASPAGKVIRFWTGTWTKKRIKEASSIEPDLLLKLPGGETVRVHAALMAQGCDGLLAGLRLPGAGPGDIPDVDLSGFDEAVVGYLLRRVYDIGYTYSDSKSFERLEGYLYGQHKIDKFARFVPPNGPDVLTDLWITCGGQELLCAHRIILSRRLRIPVEKELDWSRITSAQARALLDYLYSGVLDVDSAAAVIEAARTLDLPQVPQLMRKQVETEAERLNNVRGTHGSDSDRWFRRPQYAESANRFRAMCAAAPDLFADIAAPVELMLERCLGKWVNELSEFEINPHGLDSHAWQRTNRVRRADLASTYVVFGYLRLARALRNEELIRRWMVAAQLTLLAEPFVRIKELVMPDSVSFRGLRFAAGEERNLGDNLVCNPKIKVDLGETNIGDGFLAGLLKRGYDILSLKLDGCTDLSIAVQKLLRHEVPSAEELQTDSPLVRYVAASRGEQYVAAVAARFGGGGGGGGGITGAVGL